MSEFSAASERFWREFNSDIAGSLTDEQRGEIGRVLKQSFGTVNKDVSDLRLSFGWFFVRLAWGSEKRSRERIKKEQELYPPTARRNLPALGSIFAGSLVFFYVALALSAASVAYFMS